jgi:hypothetical protein
MPSGWRVPPTRTGTRSFGISTSQVKSFLAAGEPVVSVDAKKKELLGRYKNAGREWQPQGEPEEVNVYDFLSQAEGRAIPYGVYEVGSDVGWVSVGRAFADRDMELVKRAVEGDDEVDGLYDRARDDLDAATRKYPDHAVAFNRLSIVALYLERIADHAVNIAERVAYMMTGNFSQLAHSHAPPKEV